MMHGMNVRRLVASLLVGAAVGWGMSLAPLARPRATLPPPRYGDQPPSCFFSPDGRHLVRSHLVGGPIGVERGPGNVGTACLWDVARGEQIAVLRAPKRLINSVTFSPNGTAIAGRQEDGKILVWDRATGTLRDEIWFEHLKEAHPNTQIVYADDGGLLFQDARDWTTMRHVGTGKVAFDFRPHVRDCGSATVNFQNFYLAAGNRQAVVVGLATGAVIARFESPGDELDVNGVLSPDGRALALWMRGDSARIAVWTSEGNTTLPRMTWLNQTWNLPNRLALSNSGKLLAVQASHHPLKWIFFGEASRDPRHRIHVIDPETGREDGRIPDGQNAAFSPDDRTLAVGLADGTVQLWDLPLRRPWGWIGLAALAAAAMVFGLLTWRARRKVGLATGHR
jgi:WD40 repeat protein